MNHKLYLALPLALVAILTASSVSQTPTIPRPVEVPRQLPPPAGPVASNATTFEWREFATRDLENPRLLAVHGNLQFTVNGVNYVYYPRTNEHSTPAADVTACIAVIGELRKADVVKVQVPIHPPDLLADRTRVVVSDLVIPLGKLR